MAMDKIKQVLSQNVKIQALILVIFVTCTSLGVYLTAKSVTSFLLLLASLLMLYYTSFSNRVKWIIGGIAAYLDHSICYIRRTRL